MLNMVFVESIYHIWIQRNKQIFEAQMLKPQQVVWQIVFTVACRSKQDVNQLILQLLFIVIIG